MLLLPNAIGSLTQGIKVKLLSYISIITNKLFNVSLLIFNIFSLNIKFDKIHVYFSFLPNPTLEPGNPPHASDKSDALLNRIKAAQKKKWMEKQAQMSNNDEVNKYEKLTNLTV